MIDEHSNWLRQLFDRIGSRRQRSLQQDLKTRISRAEEELARLSEVSDRVSRDISRLAREQLKMNSLLEHNVSHWEKTINQLAAEREAAAARYQQELATIEQQTRDEITGIIVPELIQLLDDLWEARRVMRRAVSNDVLIEWSKAMETLHRQGETLLGHFGISPIKATGEPFDPHLHQAVERVVNENVPPNTVVDEWLRGYCRNDQVLRFAQVIVAQAGPQQPEREDTSPVQEQSPQRNVQVQDTIREEGNYEQNAGN